jgi:hypothetical protein
LAKGVVQEPFLKFPVGGGAGVSRSQNLEWDTAGLALSGSPDDATRLADVSGVGDATRERGSFRAMSVARLSLKKTRCLVQHFKTPQLIGTFSRGSGDFLEQN